MFDLAGIDFHVSNIVSIMRENIVAAFARYNGSSSNRQDNPYKELQDVSEADLRTWMWECRSSLNMREPPIPEDKLPVWNDCAHALADKVAFELLKHKGI